MELYDVMRTTGAVRRFTDDPLPDEVLERILDNARFAPSGGNRQGVAGDRGPGPTDPRGDRRLERHGCAALHRANQKRRRPVESRAAHAGFRRGSRRHRGPAVSGRARARRGRRARGLRGPQRRRGVRPVPRPHRRHSGRVGVPVRLEHPSGRAQRGLRRRADHDGGGRGASRQGAARHTGRLCDRGRAADRQTGEAGQQAHAQARRRDRQPASDSTGSRLVPHKRRSPSHE